MLPNIDITEDDYQNRLLLKCFLAFYFMNFKMPYINCNNFKNKDIVAGTKNIYNLNRNCLILTLIFVILL